MKQFSSSMLKSYLRTPVAYSVASNYSGVVIGTGNLDEDGYLYYYCKFGDGAVDIGLIWDLHKSEVFTVTVFAGHYFFDHVTVTDKKLSTTNKNQTTLSRDE